jgi:hypothetical protein
MPLVVDVIECLVHSISTNFFRILRYITNVLTFTVCNILTKNHYIKTPVVLLSNLLGESYTCMGEKYLVKRYRVK